MNTAATRDTLGEVSQIVAQTLKLPAGRLDVDAEFDSFGMDSIITMELITNLSKRFSGSINPAQFTEINTVRELAVLIEKSDAASASASSNADATAPAIVVAAEAPVMTKPAAEGFDALVMKSAPARRTMTRTERPRDSAVDALLRFVKDRFGLNLSGHRFANVEALQNYLLQHHRDVLLAVYGNQPTTTVTPVAEKQVTNVLGDVAIVGLSCRFPDAPDASTFWQNLLEQKNSIREIPATRWDWQQHYSVNGEAQTTCSKWGALIDNVRGFDPEFFGLSVADAELVDPQERLLTEEVYKAFEDAGIDVSTLAGSRTGVFVGYEYTEYEHYLRGCVGGMAEGPMFSSSSQTYYLANRISYLLDLCGPSEAINTNCASSAVAVNRAYQSLLSKEADVAVAGGVCLHLFVNDYIAASQFGLLSTDGTCGVFDENANGFTRGEGVGVVVLKRLEDAKRDNDRIYCVIKASHQNNRGRASSLSEIKHESITKVISECYTRAGIAADTVRYIEVDGYATKWGDSFEFEGIKNVFSGRPIAGKTCALGSVKGNIGHLEPASGVASVIKVALALRNGCFPATITKTELSSFIDVAGAGHPLYLADQPLPFADLRAKMNAPIRAGVNSFADSGVNVHILMEEYCEHEDAKKISAQGEHLFVLSAQTNERLLAHIEQFHKFLSYNDEIKFFDMLYSLQVGRTAQACRLAIVVGSIKDIINKLALVQQKGLSQAAGLEKRGIFVAEGVSSASNPVLKLVSEEVLSQQIAMHARAGKWHELALTWVSGVNVPWKSLWQDHDIKPMSLPHYPFAQVDCWFGDSTVVSNTPTKSEHQQADTSTVITNPPSSQSNTPSSVVWLMGASAANEGQQVALSAEEKALLLIRQTIAHQLNKSIEEIEIDKNYFELGMASLGVAALVQKVNQTLRVRVAPSVLFNYPDIQSFSSYLCEHHGDALSSLLVSKRGGVSTAADDVQMPGTALQKNTTDIFPLSIAQQGLYLVQSLDLQSGVYNVPLCFKASQQIDTRLLNQAWQNVQSDFPILTMRFVDNDGRIEHRVHDQGKTALIERQWDCRSDEDAVLHCQQQAKVSFDIANGPLTRFTVFRGKTDHVYGLLVIHHLVCDGLSAVLVLRRLVEHYRSLQCGEPMAPINAASFEQFVAWEKSALESEEGEAQADYWAKQLHGELSRFQMATESASFSSPIASRTLLKSLSPELSKWINEYCRAQGLPASVFFLACYGLLLQQQTWQQDEIIIGMPVLGRGDESFMYSVGHFVNMLPMRLKLTRQESLKSFLKQVQGVMFDALYHSNYPFPLMLKTLKTKAADRHPVFQVMFAYQDFVEQEDAHFNAIMTELDWQPVESVSQESEFDLGLEVYEQANGHSLHFKFNEVLYSESQIEILCTRFERLLREIAQDSERNIGEYRGISETERHRVLNEFNATSEAYDQTSSVHERFVAQAKAQPKQIAVVYENQQLSYGELYEQSHRLALYLQAQGVGPDSLVVVCMERSPNMLVAMLAVWQAGGAYVPLDPNYPEERLRYILADSAASIVLTQSTVRESLQTLLPTSIQLLALDGDAEHIAEEVKQLRKRKARLRNLATPSHLAYVIYTSGSTGQPKGVMVEHRNLMALCHWHINRFGVDETSIATQTANAAFDAATWEIWPYLLSLAKVVIVKTEMSLDIDALATFIAQEQVSHCFLVTPIAQQALSAGVLKTSALRYLLVGGDKLASYDDRQYRFELVNNYGPTESTVVATSGSVKAGTSPDIGRPISNTQIYILDDALNPLPVGSAGELHIAGAGLARGYWNRAELTQEKFIANPFSPGSRLYKTGDLARWREDGTLEYLGRIDTQIKLRGYRIEIGEIETQINRCEGVKESVVVVQGEGADKRLVGFYVASDEAVTANEIRTQLQHHLPDYMVPSAWMVLDTLPLTANGKVDRRRLQNEMVIAPRTREKVGARNHTEQQLLQIWSQILQMDSEQISVHDNFFELGGHSLMATQLLAKIKEHFALAFPVKMLFEISSIAELAQLIEATIQSGQQALLSPTAAHKSNDEETEEFTL